MQPSSFSAETHVLGDWGTTRLRLFLVEDGAVVDRVDGPGIGHLDTPPARILRDRLAIWNVDGAIHGVTLCGMVGARGGLIEAGYVDCPATIADWRGREVRMSVAGIPITVLPGLCCRSAAGVPDVMRGEETQIFGAFSMDPGLEKSAQTLLLPGTHSKWATVRQGVVQGFRTSPTGELYALLTQHSTLTGPATSGSGDFDEGFQRGLARRSEPLTGALFEARAARLLDDRSCEWSQGYLSGLLIGGEVAAHCEAGQDVTLVGDPALCALYGRALQEMDCGHWVIDGEAAVLVGLRLASGVEP